MILFFSILISLFLGFLSCLLIFRKEGASHPHFDKLSAGSIPFNKRKGTINFRFLINLSLPLGIGFSSVIFILLNLLGLGSSLIFLIEAGIVIFLVLKFIIYRKTGYPFEWFSSNKPPAKFGGFSFMDEFLKNPILFLATIIYFYSWLMDIGIYYFDSIQNPHGLWDAWACWNLNAKFISGAPQD